MTGTSAITFDEATSPSESVDFVRITVLLDVSTVPVLVVVVMTLRRVNVLSCRFKTADLSTNFTSLSVAVSVVLVRTNFGPEFVDGNELIPVTDVFLIELLRDTDALRSGSFFQCVSTRAFTFFKSIPVPFAELQFSFEPFGLVIFLSFKTRALSVRFTKLPSAGRRVAAVVVMSPVFLMPCTSPWWIKF